MWIVSLALRRPYTVAVMAITILVMAGLSTTRMRRDIFPSIDIPVVLVVWNYPGLLAEDMERRVVLLSERAYSTTVNGISRIESESRTGIGLLKIYFEPGSDIGAAIAQIASVSQTAMRTMPPGITAPNVIQFNASNVSVAQITVQSDIRSEQELFDYGLNFLRIRLFTVPGLSVPAPYGGKSRQVMVDLDPSAIAANGLSPKDVLNALLSANLILPAGAMRTDAHELDVTINNSPLAIEDFARIPVKVANGAEVLLGDVAKVHDGFAIQNNIVRVNGNRATYLALLKKADASTLAVIDSVKEMLPALQAAAPEGMVLSLDFDQSVFIRAAIGGVLHEGWVSSLLVSVMVMAFLGSWRSVLIVCTSIPLAIGVSLIGLFGLGESLNVMTLGGLSLAIGMLVDDATVEVENIHRNRHLGKPLTIAIMEGAAQIATPALAATLTICIVFSPVVLLTGAARFLFTPLAESVVIAMMASYILSRTLVPVLARMLMAKERIYHLGMPVHGPMDRFNRARDKGFARLQEAYGRLLEAALSRRGFVLLIVGVLLAQTYVLAQVVGTDFFPEVDAGLMRMHVRAPLGTRIEDTEQIIASIEREIRNIVPASELKSITDDIGIPTAYNLAFIPTDSVGGQDADLLVALNAKHAPTVGYRQDIRAMMEKKFAGVTMYFQPADIMSQVLNFGLSAPVDVRIEGMDLEQSAQTARVLRDAMKRIPGAVDVHIVQGMAHPAVALHVDREYAAQLGLTQQNVADSMITSLSSSALVSPSYWLNPHNSVNYLVALQTPLAQLNNLDALMATPISGSGSSGYSAATPFASAGNEAPYLGSIAHLSPTQTRSLISHSRVQRVVNVQCGIEGRDLGGVAKDIKHAIDTLTDLPPGTRISIEGQSESMNGSFSSLGIGLVLASLLVYLLMVTLFQSWIDPFIIMMAVPGALIGVITLLAVTGTTINVESLMGTIMSVGVAVSNSILLVSFANELRETHQLDAMAAALEAGKTRLRPVLMTALAMVLGMLPMALAYGEGGEQNAPLGRAVIGGLLVATCMTLIVVPVVYSLVRRAMPNLAKLDAHFEAEMQASPDTQHP